VDDLQFQTLPSPTPGAGEVVLKVHAASLNFPDLLIVQNKYQFKPPLPFVPGAECAGVVQAVGAGVSLQVGQKVACFGNTGGFATEAVMPQAACVALPAEFDMHEAAAFLLTYATSHHALLDRGALQAAETVLVLGAAGGVGTSAIQIAKAVGARVIAAVSNATKAQFCRSLGADETIDYSQGPAHFREEIKRITQGRGPDVIYDPVGADLAEPAFRSIAWRGRYLVIGFAGGPIPALPLNLMLLKGASVVGVFWGDFARREPAQQAQVMRELIGWWQQGKVRPVLDRVLPMSELKQAYALMGSRAVQGKLVLSNTV
jgi:NADPH2:quinone reductase